MTSPSNGRLAAFCLALATACATPLPPTPRPAEREAGRRVQDLDWMVAAIRHVHPGPSDGESVPAFDAEAARLRAALPELDREEVFLGLMRVVALIGDSHTRFLSWETIQDPYLPISIGAWQEEFWIDSVQADRADLFGRRLVAVGGAPLDEVVERLAPYLPHENDVVLRNGVASLLSASTVLEHVGLARAHEPVELTLSVPDAVGGGEETVRIAARPAPEFGPWIVYRPAEAVPALHAEQPDERWWWCVLEAEQAAFLQVDVCEDARNPSFAERVGELFQRIDAGGIGTLVVDLRWNVGGDSSVLRPLIDGAQARPELEVRVLIGRNTYSSAMLNAWQLREEAGALLLGEPTAQKPNSFGETIPLELPNSGLRLDCSTTRFYLVPGDPPTLAPDVLVPTTFRQSLLGEDPVLRAALE